MNDIFKRYMDALAEVLHQELPDVADARAEFAIDGIPYVITADAASPGCLLTVAMTSRPKYPPTTDVASAVRLPCRCESRGRS